MKSASRLSPAASFPTPFSLGYRMPAEWEPHHATWLGWPHERTDWPGKFAAIPWAFAEIVRHLSQVERVYLLVEDASAEARARAILKKSGANLKAVDFFRVPTNRGWMRDSGPICVKNSAGDVVFTHWMFNGWAKYRNYRKDCEVVTKVNSKLKHRVWQPAYKGRRLVLEGGSIDANGRGTLLTTEECLLSPVQARNPGLTRAEIEEALRDYLGATHVLWLKKGIAGDDTHGHVDDLARFTGAHTVVTVVEEDRADANYAPLRENLARLKRMKDQDGRALRWRLYPCPRPFISKASACRPATPTSTSPTKSCSCPPSTTRAIASPSTPSPGSSRTRQVIGIACRDLVLGLGTIHCMTQQQPR